MVSKARQSEQTTTRFLWQAIIMPCIYLLGARTEICPSLFSFWSEIEPTMQRRTKYMSINCGNSSDVRMNGTWVNSRAWLTKEVRLCLQSKMAGEVAIADTDMDIDKAIEDFSIGFGNEILLSESITYAAKQLGFEKIEEYPRNDDLSIFQGRDVFLANLTSSCKPSKI